MAKGQPISANLLRIASSVLMQRDRVSARLGKQFNYHRVLYEVLGYKYQLDYEDYLAKYERQDIATRIVEAPCTTSWRRTPEIKEDSDDATETQFEALWKQLAKEKKVFHYLQRADILSGIGRYGILLIGVKGGRGLEIPLRDGSLKGPDDIIFLQPYGEGAVKIVEWVTDASDERFGLPLMYEVDLTSDLMGAPVGLSRQRVHYTRVIHIAQDVLENEVFGRPRLKNVMNRLEDLEKLAGGSAEMFWQGAFGGLHADVRDGWGLDAEGEQKLTDEMDEYVHGLRRFIRTQGMNIQRIQSQTADPKAPFDTIISLISSATRIPNRILLGSERGELASSQDEDNWFGYIRERISNYTEPMILRRFVDWCIAKGVLPAPEGGEYMVEWPPLYEMSDTEKANIAKIKTDALKAYAPGGATELIVPPGEFREKFLGMDAEPDKKYLKDVLTEALDERREEAQKQFEQGKGQQSPGKGQAPGKGGKAAPATNSPFAPEVNFNPYHDEKGRFASKSGRGGGVAKFTEDKATSLQAYQDGGYQDLNASLRGNKVDTPQDVLDERTKNMDALVDEATPQELMAFRGDGGGLTEATWESTGIAADMARAYPNGVRVDDFTSGKAKAPDGGEWNKYLSDRLVGVEFVDQGYVSTTRDMSVANRFGYGSVLTRHGCNGLATIHGKVKAIDVDSTSVVRAGESEMILGRGHRYRVAKVSLEVASQGGVSSSVGFRLRYNLEIVD